MRKQKLVGKEKLQNQKQNNMGNFDTHKWFKKQYLEEASFGAAGTDKRSGQVIGEIIQMIKDTGIDPSDVLEEVGQEFGIAFEFGRGQ